MDLFCTGSCAGCDRVSDFGETVITAEDREILARALAGRAPEIYSGAGQVFSNTTPDEWNRLVRVGLVNGETGETIEANSPDSN